MPPAPPPHQVFLLSPANAAGKLAGFLLRKDARSALAQRLRSAEGATIGEVFTFMSGLYFRGKLAYASAFADPPDGCGGVYVIVPGMGLRPPRPVIDLEGWGAIVWVRFNQDNGLYPRLLRHVPADLAERLE